MLTILYKSFYNFGAVKEWIKNGKGTGTSLLAVLAFLLALGFVGVVGSQLGNVTEEKVRAAVDKAFEKLPEIVIQDGELQWKKGVVEKFVLEDKSTIIVDTVNVEPRISDIEDSIVYVTKTKVYVNNKGKIQPVAFKDLQALSGKNPWKIDAEEVTKWTMAIMKYVFWGVMVFGFIFGFLFFWWANVILGGLVRFIISKVNATAKAMEYTEIRRMATASVIPAIFVMDIVQYVGGWNHVWLKWAVVVIAGVTISLTKYLKKEGE